MRDDCSRLHDIQAACELTLTFLGASTREDLEEDLFLKVLQSEFPE